MSVIRPLPGHTRPHDAFWAEIAPCEHLVQLYHQEGAFLDSLEDFVGNGLANDESVIVIGTSSHLGAMDARMRARGIALDDAIATDRYIPLDAADTLGQFMRDSWPDEDRFHALIAQLLARARAGGRKVRAFGEMVAIMWARGEQGATVRLEHLWHELCKNEQFPLFCAYPHSGFTQDTGDSMAQICAAHSRVVPLRFA